MQVNNKSNTNLGVVNMQGSNLPYQDNIMISVGGSQGGQSFQNANGNHGYVMNKVPSKLGSI